MKGILLGALLSVFAVVVIPTGTSNFAEITVVNSVESKYAFDSILYIGSDERECIGAAVVVKSGGYCVTAHHVWLSKDAKWCKTKDGNTKYQMELIHEDKANDLVLFKVNADLPVVVMNDVVAVGEDVYAVGHPFGYRYSVTKGVISSLDRTIEMPTGEKVTTIQTDAAVNPGNSGGALLNGRGEMVGVVIALYREATGIAFVVPVSVVKTLVEKVK